MKLLAFVLFLFWQSPNCEEATEISPTNFCSFLPGDTQWYKFSIENPEVVSIITAGNGDGRMELYKGDCDNLEYVTEDDNSGPFLMPQIQLNAEADVDYYVKVTGVDLFEICVFTCGPLPVTLISYKVYQTNGYATLKWVTGSEINNRLFRVYSSTDAISWFMVGQIPGMGNSSQLNYYSYNDFNKLDNEVRYYKLEQIDYNGTVTTLGILPVFSKKEYKVLLKEINLAGQPVNKDYKGIRVKIYSDKTVEKLIFQ